MRRFSTCNDFQIPIGAPASSVPSLQKCCKKHDDHCTLRSLLKLAMRVSTTQPLSQAAQHLISLVWLEEMYDDLISLVK